MGDVKTKKFGRVHALFYKENNGPFKPGVSINLDCDYLSEDEFAGQWLRIPEAKKLLVNLQKAIEYAEKLTPQDSGEVDETTCSQRERDG